MPDLFIAVPTTGSVTSALAAFFVDARERGCEVRLFNHYSPIPYARNVIVTAFLASESERLWMIDSDMIPPSNLWTLTETDGDIVGPIYPRGAIKMPGNKPVLENVAHRFKDLDDYKTQEIQFHLELGQGPVPVDSTGTACMIVRRKVIEDERMRVAATGENGVIPMFRSTFEDDGRYVYGNDIDFCVRARKLGYSVVINTQILCGHMKTFDLATVVKMIEVHRGTIPPEAVGLVRI